MLNFPYPYMGEWWFSVVSRYHVWSGNTRNQTTTMDLFGKTFGAISSLVPNGNIGKAIRQITDDDEVLKEVILNCTLFRYFTRFHFFDTKQEFLNKALRGELVPITSVRRFSGLSTWQPRFCLQCTEEEFEPYWHVAHQIPLITSCVKHGTVLQQANIKTKDLQHRYLPLTSVLNGAVEYFPCIAERAAWSVELSKILNSYYELPLSASVNPNWSNLAVELANKGYAQLNNKSEHTLIKSRALYGDLVHHFGSKLIEEYFGPPEMHILLNRLCKWQGQVPERYAILQCFAGIPSEQVFSEQREPDSMFERICAIMETPMPVTKKQVLTELGLTNLQLDNLLKKYNLTPFWRPAAANSIRKPYKLSCSFTEADYQLFEEAFNQSGYRYRSEFIEDIVMAKIKNRD